MKWIETASQKVEDTFRCIWLASRKQKKNPKNLTTLLSLSLSDQAPPSQKCRVWFVIKHDENRSENTKSKVRRCTVIGEVQYLIRKKQKRGLRLVGSHSTNDNQLNQERIFTSWRGEGKKLEDSSFVHVMYIYSMHANSASSPSRFVVTRPSNFSRFFWH
jgi:hypothetical protein